jgi:hypothetical protein
MTTIKRFARVQILTIDEPHHGFVVDADERGIDVEWGYAGQPPHEVRRFAPADLRAV